MFMYHSFKNVQIFSDKIWTFGHRLRIKDFDLKKSFKVEVWNHGAFRKNANHGRLLVSLFVCLTILFACF